MKIFRNQKHLLINSEKKHISANTKKISQSHEGGVSVTAIFARHKSGGDDIDINDDESFTKG